MLDFFFTSLKSSFSHQERLSTRLSAAFRRRHSAMLPLLCVALVLASFHGATSHGEHPLSRILIHKATVDIDGGSFVKAHPTILGTKGETSEWVSLEFFSARPSSEDYIAVFSPANFSSATCKPDGTFVQSKIKAPFLCSAPIKYRFANDSSPSYGSTGNGSSRFRLINQRLDFSFALFSGGLESPKVVAVSNTIAFANPKAPVYPRLAQGKTWNEMTVTWTSGYDISEAAPFVEWAMGGENSLRSPAGTLTFDRNRMCGPPAKTVGWRDPGFIHTSFLKELWPNAMYTYRLGHKLLNGSYVWSKAYQFKASPYPGQNSLQRVVVFGDMGKDEDDGSNEYNYQRGSLNTTKQLVKDLSNIDIVFHIGDITYADGYLSQWDQFTAQIEPISSSIPYMLASGNHERDWPGTGSFYGNINSGGECGVLAETMFYAPAENRGKYWYATDYGMFRFCVADTEHDWREGSEQYVFLERCLATAERGKQPWLIFLAHRVLGYSSSAFYADQGSFGEPMGKESLQKLWQKYKVDVAIFGHVHSYERTCPVYEYVCTNPERNRYGLLNGTIHVVAGGAGANIAELNDVNATWSLFRDFDYGFVKMTSFNYSHLLFEYMRSSDGKVYDSFTVSREYSDVVACTADSCAPSSYAAQDAKSADRLPSKRRRLNKQN